MYPAFQELTNMTLFQEFQFTVDLLDGQYNDNIVQLLFMFGVSGWDSHPADASNLITQKQGLKLSQATTRSSI